MSLAEVKDIVVEQYANWEEILVFQSAATHQPKPLTGIAIIGEIRRAYNDAAPVATFSVLIADITGGVFSMSLTRDDTALLAVTQPNKATYFYDWVAVRNSDGYRRRIREGGVIVRPGVTR